MLEEDALSSLEITALAWNGNVAEEEKWRAAARGKSLSAEVEADPG